MKSKYDFEIQKTEQEWKEQLSEDEFRVLRKAGTEMPGTGAYYLNDDSGNYYCKACNNELFTSDNKYQSGCGWPSFFDVVDETKIIKRPDFSHDMIRTEVLCAKCGSHLGHLFEDGPTDKTGIRYCINSISLNFKNNENIQE